MDHTEEQQGQADVVGFMEKALLFFGAIVAAGLIFITVVAVLSLERVAS